MASPKTIVILDDTILDVVEMQDVLSNNGFEPIALSSAKNAYPKIEQEQPDVLLVNPELGSIDADEFFEDLRSRTNCPQLVVVVVGEHSATQLQDMCSQYDLNAYFSKDLDFNKLPGFVEDVFG